MAVLYVSNSPQELQVTFFGWSSFVISVVWGDAFSLRHSWQSLHPPAPFSWPE
jgi:hypothetical protein